MIVNVWEIIRDWVWDSVMNRTQQDQMRNTQCYSSRRQKWIKNNLKKHRMQYRNTLYMNANRNYHCNKSNLNHSSGVNHAWNDFHPTTNDANECAIPNLICHTLLESRMSRLGWIRWPWIILDSESWPWVNTEFYEICCPDVESN